MPRPRADLRALAAPGIAAVRQNWRPFVAIQLAALLLVLLYFFVPAVTRFCGRVAGWREAGGVWAAMLATALAGAILPELARLLTRRGWRLDREKLNDLAFLLPVFAVNGLIVDGLYRLLGLVVGHGNDWPTVLAKAALDQFVFTPLLALPLTALVFSWRRLRFSATATLRELGPRWYARRVLTLQLPGWCFWGPMVVLIYSLPGPLQFVLFVLAMAAWSLVLVFIGSDKPAAAA